MSSLHTFILVKLFNLKTQKQVKASKEAFWGEETEFWKVVSLLCCGGKDNLIHVSAPKDAI